MQRRQHTALAILVLALWTLPSLRASAQSDAASEDDEDVVDVVVAADPHPSPTPPSASGAAPVTAADLEALRSEITTLRRELDEARVQIAADEATPVDEALEAEEEAAEAAATSEPTFSPFGSTEARNPLGTRIADGLYLSSYIQAQYAGREDSRTELSASGSPLNYDGFALRRARLKLVGDAEYYGGVIEINGTTSFGGFQAQVRRAEGWVGYRLHANETPLVLLAAGVNDNFFGYDLNYSSRNRAP